jgi:NADPH:quinone reductase-like Zn-dependent oxidoreductase
MRAWRFHEFGHVKNLRMEELAIPKPARGEVLVKIDYAALNPADAFLVMGRYPGAGKPPFAVGRDGCGRITDTNSTSRFKLDDKVVFTGATVGITREGTLAEYVAIPEGELAVLPHWWSPEDGAAGTKVFLTAWQALADTAKLKAGETVMLTAATGGVGLAALALSKAMGARTIATGLLELSGSPEKAAKLSELGADHVFDTNDPDITEKIQALGGADVILELVGGDSFPRSIALLNPFGRLCVIGALGGTRCEINPMDILFKRIQIHGIQVSMYSEAESQQAFAALCQALEPGETKLLIDKVFPFEQVQEGLAYLRHGPMGKVLVGPVGD